MIDLKLTPSGDLDLSAFDLGRVENGEQVAQRVGIRLRTFLGEVALNTQAGVPWFEEILGVKPVPLNRVEAILREQILTTPEIVSLERFDVDYVAASRTYTVAFKALSSYGPVEDVAAIPEV